MFVIRVCKAVSITHVINFKLINTMSQLTILHDRDTSFPALENALSHPNGLLALGGTLSTQRLLDAYQRGIFPWYSEDDPIMWWSPNPRCIIYTDQFHVSRSFKRCLNQSIFTLTLNKAFDQVINRCAQPRPYEENTWINQDIIDAYIKLHQQGHAHSVEVWKNNQLVGGIYGVYVGNIFCGESMFSATSNASKTGLYGLCRWLHQHNVGLLDCQVTNSHLLSLGATEISRNDFATYIDDAHKAASVQQIDWSPQELTYV